MSVIVRDDLAEAHRLAGLLGSAGAAIESTGDVLAVRGIGPERVGEEAAAAGVTLEKLPLKAMQAVEPRITKAVYGVLSVGNSVKSRKVYGGTAPQNVWAQAKRWLKLLKKRP